MTTAADLADALEQAGHGDLAEELRGRKPPDEDPEPISIDQWLRDSKAGRRAVLARRMFGAPDADDDPPAAA